MSEFDDLISDAQIDNLFRDENEDPTIVVTVPKAKKLNIPLNDDEPTIKRAVKTNPGGLITKPTAVIKTHKKKEKLNTTPRKPQAIGRISKVRTEQLIAPRRDENTTNPVIRTLDLNASGLSILDIYKNAGLGNEHSEDFNVFRVESMLDDTSIFELDDKAKEAAVALALKSHNVKINTVVEDAKDHQFALDAHDIRFNEELGALKGKIDEENGRLHAEIERYANPRIERMEANEARVEALEQKYEEWSKKKDKEYERLDVMLSRWEVLNGTTTASLSRRRSTQPFGVLEEISNPDEKPLSKPSFVLSKLSEDENMSSISEDFSIQESSFEHADLTEDLGGTHAKRSGFKSILYGFAVVCAISFWIFGAFSLAIVIDSMQPLAAVGLTLGVPLGFAIFMGLISKGHGPWLGYIAFLGYCGIAITLLAHLDIGNLVRLASENPVWLTEPSVVNGTPVGLTESVAESVTNLFNSYADFLKSLGVNAQQ